MEISEKSPDNFAEVIAANLIVLPKFPCASFFRSPKPPHGIWSVGDRINIFLIDFSIKK